MENKDKNNGIPIAETPEEKELETKSAENIHEEMRKFVKNAPKEIVNIFEGWGKEKEEKDKTTQQDLRVFDKQQKKPIDKNATTEFGTKDARQLMKESETDTRETVNENMEEKGGTELRETVHMEASDFVEVARGKSLMDHFSQDEQILLKKESYIFPRQVKVLEKSGLGKRESEEILWKTVETSMKNIDKKATLLNSHKRVLQLLENLRSETLGRPLEDLKKTLSQITRPYTNTELQLKAITEKILDSETVTQDAFPALQDIIARVKKEKATEPMGPLEYANLQKIYNAIKTKIDALAHAIATWEEKTDKILKSDFSMVKGEMKDTYVFQEEYTQLGIGGAGKIYKGLHAIVTEQGKNPEVFEAIEKITKCIDTHEYTDHERKILQTISDLSKDDERVKTLLPRLFLADEERIIMENLGGINMWALQREMSDASTGKEKKEKLEKTFYSCLADAMEAADWMHENKLIHRDIKPANIMITKTDKPEVMRGTLIDFGITEHQTNTDLQSQAFKKGATVGTTGYFDMRIYFGDEEGKNEKILSPRTDIFAFAIILLEQRTDFNLDTVIKEVASKSDSQREPSLKFMEQFEEYRKKLLWYSLKEKNKELRHFFLNIFQTREYQDNIIRDDQIEEPTLKKLIEITRKLTE